MGTIITTITVALVCAAAAAAQSLPYPIVDTHQTQSFDDHRAISAPSPAGTYYGQDAQYRAHAPAYRNNGDGTVPDLVTGLMCQAAPATGLTWMQVDSGELKAGPNHDGKMNWPQALQWAEQLKFAGHDD